MDGNNNDERTLVDKGKEIVKNKAKQETGKLLKKLLIKLLPYLGIFFAILLFAGLLVAGQQLIMNLFQSILGIFGNDEEDVVQMNKITIAAQQVHDAQLDWTWEDENSGKLINKNITASLNNEKKGTNCSTYVAGVLYTAGCITDNNIYYLSPHWLEYHLNEYEWPKITKEEYLRPGDIVFMHREGASTTSEHVQIYAGAKKWYNAGSTIDIQDVAPKEKTNWMSGWDTWCAYRAPELLELYPIPQELITIDPLTGAYKTNVEEYAEQILAELEKQKVNNEVIGFNTEELGDMIEKYIRTEIKTSNIKTDLPDNEEDGIIVIKRASLETETVIDLKYVEYKRFCERIEKRRRGW